MKICLAVVWKRKGKVLVCYSNCLEEHEGHAKALEY